MKYFIKTFGCQMNYSDSERIATVLENLGFQEASLINEATLVIINTCGVRQMAEDRVYGLVHNLRFKNKDLGFKIILTGCLADRKNVYRKLKDKVDLFVDIKNFRKDVKKFLKSYILNLNSCQDNSARSYLSIKPKYKKSYFAYVPIMTGCNNFCAYCVVPYARGREISRDSGEIIKEIKGLIKKGYKEIMLLGQNVNSYQFIDKNSSAEALAKADRIITFPKLLKKIIAIPGSFKISFMTSHPKDMSDELIDIIAQSPKISKTIHLPVQSGDSQILKKMNRKYSATHYLNLIKKIRQKIPSVRISTDIIVGFPGETKKQFENTVKLCQKVGFVKSYTSQYSPRPGTAAAKLNDNIPKAEKKRRWKILDEMINKK
jgi:tRNA-2-methylthio-N6-dimethylallyladenosine synthase